MTNPEITRAKATTGGAAMSDTPRTDFWESNLVPADFARTLERELSQLRAERDHFKKHYEEKEKPARVLGECLQTALVQRDAALAKLEEAKAVIETANHAMTWYCWHEQPDHDCMEYKAITRARAFLDQPKGEQG